MTLHIEYLIPTSASYHHCGHGYSSDLELGVNWHESRNVRLDQLELDVQHRGSNLIFPCLFRHTEFAGNFER